jgi:thiamine-monophosphate kinase
LRELGLLDALWEIITPVTGPAALGPGDDAALIPLDGPAIVSVDQTVAGIHTDPRFVTHEDFGWRSVTTALSDLAAMGCEARAVLIGLTYPSDTSATDLKAFAKGADSAATQSGARIFGGDVSSGPVMSASVTVIGEPAPGGKPVTRSGAQVGDLIGVTGSLGGSAGGLELLRVNAEDQDGLRYRRPTALINEGIALAKAGVTSMIDISDGVATDAGHLGKASGVRLNVDLDRIPIDPICARASILMGIGAAELAVTGGEDFELLFTAPAELAEQIEHTAGRQVSWVGHVAEGEGGCSLDEVGLSGWQH